MTKLKNTNNKKKNIKYNNNNKKIKKCKNKLK